MTPGGEHLLDVRYIRAGSGPKSIRHQLACELRIAFIDPLFAQVDASALIVFRVMFGLIMLIECWPFWSKGWIERH